MKLKLSRFELVVLGGKTVIIVLLFILIGISCGLAYVVGRHFAEQLDSLAGTEIRLTHKLNQIVTDRTAPLEASVGEVKREGAERNEKIDALEKKASKPTKIVVSVPTPVSPLQVVIATPMPPMPTPSPTVDTNPNHQGLLDRLFHKSGDP